MCVKCERRIRSGLTGGQLLIQLSETTGIHSELSVEVQGVNVPLTHWLLCSVCGQQARLLTLKDVISMSMDSDKSHICQFCRLEIVERLLCKWGEDSNV